MEEEEEEEEGEGAEVGAPPLEAIIDYPDVWQLNSEARRVLHEYWREEVRSEARGKIRELTETYAKSKRRVADVDREIELAMLRKCKVVGMTTTGAAKHHELLMALKVGGQENERSDGAMDE